MLAQMQWDEMIVDPLRQMITIVLSYLPVIIGALLILIIGWLIAIAVKALVNKLLKVVHFDELSERAGITRVLNKGEIRSNARQIISGLFYWLIIIMTLVAVANALGLPKASDLLNQLFAYIPNVIAALLVIFVAMFLANVVAQIVQVTAGNANLPKPKILSAISKWAIIAFAIAVALAQLKIAEPLVTTAFNIILAGVVLALALAFGLGGKETASKWLEDMRQRRLQHH